MGVPFAFFVTCQGTSILSEDLSDLPPGDELERTLNAARRIIAGQPPDSVLALFDATDASFDTHSLSLIKDVVKANEPDIEASVTVDIKGLLDIAMTAVSTATGRTFRSFNGRESALDYLAFLRPARRDNGSRGDGKHPATASEGVVRGARRKREDSEVGQRCGELDRFLSSR